METLSIIITAHNEGKVAERTMKSLKMAVDELIGVKVDFLINIDVGDQETKKVFRRYKKAWAGSNNVEIRETSFGDPGLARNAAIKAARGDYLMLIDADDMVSKNWLIVAMERIRREDGAVVIHPEVEFRYNEKRGESLYIRMDDLGKWRTTLLLLEGNRWCSVVLGKSKVIKEHKYSESGGGLGYEDFFFNCELVYNSVRHLVAKQTSCFLLQKIHSVTSETHSNHTVLPRVDLFNLRRLQELKIENSVPKCEEEESDVKLPTFVVVQAEELGWNKLKEMVEGLPGQAIIKDGVKGMEFGVKFVGMLEGVELLENKRVLAFVGNIVEYLEMKKKYGDDVLIVLTRDVEYLAGRRYLNTMWLANIFEYWQDMALTLLIMQSNVKTVVLNGDRLVKKWGDEHRGLEKIEIVKW